MKEIKVSANTWYVVEGTAGATVINPSTNKAIATVEEGKQTAFYATTPYVLVSDDSVNIFKATFNFAPAKLRLLGLLGGGASTPALPGGYWDITGLQTDGSSYLILGSGLIDSEMSHDFSGYYTGGFYLGSAYNTWFGLWIAANYLAWAGVSMANVRTNAPVYLTVDAENDLVTLNGVAYTGAVSAFVTPSSVRTAIFAVGQTNQISSLAPAGAKFYNWTISKNGKNVHEYIPVIDSSGVACLYDKVEKKTFYNSSNSQFIAILNSEQALKLANLPASGGSLTISLPTGYESDAGVTTALDTARSNGWTLTIQTYTPEAEASSAATFALRRIWVRRTQNENGAHVDTDGTRWHVDWCVDMLTPDGSTPDMHGYELYRSVDAAVAYWELSPWVDPEQEELLTENTYNEQ